MLRYASRAPGPLYGEVAILQALKAATTPRERQRLQGELIQVGRWAKRIRALARRWQCETVELEEFESAGVMGLLEAASRYDGGDGEGWPSYATQWALRRMQELARAQGGPIVVETQWEQRTARRQRVQRRPAGWVAVEAPAPGDEERGRYSRRYNEVCSAAREVQAESEAGQQREEQRQALPVALDRLPGWARSSLASITGERAGPLPKLEETREILRRHALRRLKQELEGV